MSIGSCRRILSVIYDHQRKMEEDGRIKNEINSDYMRLGGSFRDWTTHDFLCRCAKSAWRTRPTPPVAWKVGGASQRSQRPSHRSPKVSSQRSTQLQLLGVALASFSLRRRVQRIDLNESWRHMHTFEAQGKRRGTIFLYNFWNFSSRGGPGPPRSRVA